MEFFPFSSRFFHSGYSVAATKKGGEVMTSYLAKAVSYVLERIAVYFVQTASPLHTHRPEVPEQLK
ncbi:cyclic lactone autoinducer peptide [Paenibacillus sp. GCM10012303]|uniref:cyclic lactone autoinducer peptide n=1 Tax=Paenibacillus sp. GCM10012303 TaxID=3317340 RepID=UPI003624381F